MMAPPCLQAGTLAVHHKLLASGSAPTRNIIIHAPAQAYMFIGTLLENFYLSGGGAGWV